MKTILLKNDNCVKKKNVKNRYKREIVKTKRREKILLNSFFLY